MKECLIYFPKYTANRTPTAFGWWLQAAATYGFDAHIAYFEDFGSSRKDIPDLVIMRGYDRRVSEFYERTGCKVVNTWQSMYTSLNKWHTFQILKSAGIPTPFTLENVNAISYESAGEALGFPFVVKQVDGSRGCNVFLVNDINQYKEAIRACGRHAIAQKYISDSHGRDIRVWTIGGNAVAAVLRHSSTSFVSNYSQGGQAEAYTLNRRVATLASEAATAIGLDFAGVDILFDGNDYCVCEVNGNAGFRTLTAAGGVDILDVLFKYLK